jgi:hypothetical protein
MPLVEIKVLRGDNNFRTEKVSKTAYMLHYGLECFSVKFMNPLYCPISISFLKNFEMYFLIEIMFQ